MCIYNVHPYVSTCIPSGCGLQLWVPRYDRPHRWGRCRRWRSLCHPLHRWCWTPDPLHHCVGGQLYALGGTGSAPGGRHTQDNGRQMILNCNYHKSACMYTVEPIWLGHTKNQNISGAGYLRKKGFFQGLRIWICAASVREWCTVSLSLYPTLYQLEMQGKSRREAGEMYVLAYWLCVGSVQIYSNHMQYTVCIFHKKIVILSLWNNIQCCHPTENPVEYTQSTRIECHTATGYYSLPHRSSLGSHWSWPALPSLSSDLQSLGWPSVHSRPPRESVHPLVHHIPTHMYSGTSHNVHSEKQITPHGGKTLSQIDFTVL